MRPETRIGSRRRALEIDAASLAKAIGVSRQAIYAIENGTYIPNTAVAIRLAKAELICPQASVPEAQPVRLCRVGQKRLAFPAQRETEWLPETDGVLCKISRSG
jgi:putative molybdopterin biosynthesis protein